MNRNEVIAEAISALESEAVPSSDCDRVQKATEELRAGQVTQETVSFMKKKVDSWWETFGRGLEPEESYGELLVKDLEAATDKLKSLL